MTTLKDGKHYEERSEQIKTNRRIPVYILILIGLFFLAFVIYMLSNWLS